MPVWKTAPSSLKHAGHGKKMHSDKQLKMKSADLSCIHQCIGFQSALILFWEMRSRKRCLR